MLLFSRRPNGAVCLHGAGVRRGGGDPVWGWRRLTWKDYWLVLRQPRTCSNAAIRGGRPCNEQQVRAKAAPVSESCCCGASDS